MSLDAAQVLRDILFLEHLGVWFGVVARSCGLARDVLCIAVLCWFDPAIVAPRLAWLVEGVAFGGAGSGSGMWDGSIMDGLNYTCNKT